MGKGTAECTIQFKHLKINFIFKMTESLKLYEH